MAHSLPLLTGLIAILPVLVFGWWRLRRQRGDSAPRPQAATAAVTCQAPAAFGGDARVLMQQSQWRLYALALGFEPAARPPAAAEGGQQAVMGAVLDTLGRETLSPRLIPRRPQLLPQLIQSVNDEASSSRSIGAIIAQDPVLAGNLLRIANSALYHLPGRTVDSIERAVTLVGSEGVRQIISAALLQPVMQGGGRGDRFSALVWEYSLRVAAAAADHARSVEREDGFSAQLMGLLQGLGAVVVMQVIHAEQDRQQQTLSPPLQALALERHTGSTAACIAAHWGLAPAICAALAASDGPAAGAHALGRSLQFARTVAALAVLCQEGQMEEAQAQTLLAGSVPAHVLEWIWRRLRAVAD